MSNVESGVREAIPEPRPSESDVGMQALGERLARLDRAISRLEEVAERGQAMAAIAVDTFDETCRRAKREGVDIDERLARVMHLAERLTETRTAEALEWLLDRLPQLDEAARRLEELPGMVAMLGDMFDEWAAGMVAQGIDPETSLRQGLHAVLWLGQRVREPELERLGILLRSDVLEPHALAVVGKTGRALAACHERVCDSEGPERLGTLGLLRMLRDPDVQRALGFATQVARQFGRHLSEETEGAGEAAPNGAGR